MRKSQPKVAVFLGPPGDRAVPGEHDHRVTELLAAMGRGDQAASEELLPLVYEHLRQLACRRMAAEPPGHTLQATALVHEAYLRLFGEGAASTDWKNRGHFYGAAAEAMRRILVEQVRKHRSRKRGGDRRRVPLDQAEISYENESIDLLALDRALDLLKKHDGRMYEVAMLRHFCGLTNDQSAKVLDISPRTVRQDWSVARLWLQEAMASSAGERGRDG
jgi:RNA polymerase sigma factor (TIGR02999 family)